MGNEKYLDVDIYNVFTNSDGKKEICIYGYYYWNECGEYRRVDCVGAYMGIDGDISETISMSKQYEESLTEPQYIEDTKDLKSFTCLPISKVTNDTPDGNYLNMEE